MKPREEDELRARLDQAERERDEARAALAHERDRLADAAAVANRAEDSLGVVEALLSAKCDELAHVPARIDAAEMARDVAWVQKVCRSANRPEATEAIARALVISPANAEQVYAADRTDADIAAAIRAARGAL